MKKISILALMSITVLFSCKKDDEVKDKSGDFKGPEVTVHHGKAWSNVKLTKEGNPTEMTITLNDALINSVPVGSGGATHSHDNNLILPLHDNVKSSTPFKHIGLDYNPDGHEPTPIYGFAHFDFHFYLTTEAERAAIPVYEADSAKFKNYPGQGYMPANYIPIPGGVPQMGAHWIDVTSPELSGQPFTQTFIYGSYDGKVAFYEPMITLNFLKTTTSFSRNIPQPAKVKVSGYYPTKMKVTKHDGVTDVTMDSFVYRQAE